jgi:hypothetical protein
MIISINGMDNSGKTTQVNRLLDLYPELFIKKLHLSDSPSYNKEKFDYNWWFKESSPQEFTETMYKCLEERIKIAKELDSEGKIVIIEKGLDFYDARITSTLLSKGLNIYEAIILQMSIRRKYDLEDIEDVKIYLKPLPFRRISSIDDLPEYRTYLKNNEELLNYMNIDYDYVDFDNIDTVTNNIMNIINERRSGHYKTKKLSNHTGKVSRVCQ